MSTLPSFCKDHPHAERELQVHDIYAPGLRKKYFREVHFCCVECGARVWSPEELAKRQRLEDCGLHAHVVMA